MNTLSWLLYMSEVSERVSNMAFFLTVSSIIVFCVIGLIYMLMSTRDMSDSFQHGAPKARNIAAGIFTISLLGLLFPSQNTMYLIIASEAAEVVATDASTKAMIGDVQKIVSLKLERIADELIPQQSQERTR